MIQIKKVSKTYNRFKKNKVTAIDKTTLTFENSGMVAILGNSGCGKTTLLNMIGGLDKPDWGSIRVDGKKINSIFSSKTDNIRNAKIGYIFQNYHLMDSMTVFDNVALALKMVGIRNKKQVKDSVNYCLEKVGLYKYRNRPADTLSGGERQRVGIARAIVKNPSVIIADEPTGNLDSKNSLEIMNIIKAISKDKLVILVTHEKKLAHFFADRIVEVVDGKVVNDYVNDHNDALDYRIDNRIYLKDMPVCDDIKSQNLNVLYNSDGSVDAKVRLVIRDGNIYIQCEGRKVDVVDSGSAVELVDDHYRALTKEEADKYSFDFSRITHKKKLRYHSIYNPVTLLINGFKTVFGYPKLKKVLLLGFVISSAFIMYAFSSIAGINNVTDDEFITTNKNYVTVNNHLNTVSDYYSYLDVPGVRYIMPGSGNVAFKMDFSGYYYQTNGAQVTVSGALASSDLITRKDLICGRLPYNDHEIVIDKMITDELLGNSSLSSDSTCIMVGFSTEQDFVLKKVTLSNGEEYKIVGISNLVSPSIYAKESQFDNIIMNSSDDYGIYDYSIYDEDSESGDSSSMDENNNADITDIAKAEGTLTIKTGTLPENDYEVILNYDHRYEYKIGSQLKTKVNGVNLTVVGFYTSTKEGEDKQFTNYQTTYYKYLSTTSGITICCYDRDEVYNYLSEQNVNVINNYDSDRNAYLEEQQDTMRTTEILGAVIVAIALIEIYLILRASFLSRIKEVGTLRAIGVKKKDIYKQFVGEIIAITVLTAVPGFAIMGYVLHALTGYSYFANLYIFNEGIVLESAVVVAAFNMIAGLLPVFSTLRKTPAAILSRTDVD